MTHETENIIGGFMALFFSTFIKLAFIAAAIWMLTKGESGCAIASIIGAILSGWSYTDDKAKRGEKK